MTGGPPVRGTKLLAWRIPPVWSDVQKSVLAAPANSSVTSTQEHLVRATKTVLAAIAEDIQGGLLETVGIESSSSFDIDRCSVVLELPAGTKTERIARAIDAENVEAWCDESGRVRVGISPWLSTKDVDQTVLCTIKVIHVLLGIHAPENALQPPTLMQKLRAAIMEVMLIQKVIENKKNKT